jgi:effector-binding domain-containing protein
MIDAPRITRLQATPTAVVRLTIPREKMPEVMGPAIEEIMSTIAAQSVEPAGAVFAHHFAMDPKTFDFEVGVPVAQPITAAGRVEPGERPDVRVAQTIYHGPYQGLPGAWGKFHAWIEENGHDFAPDIWETYVDGPHSNPDPAKWRTELSRPLRREAS